MEEDEKRIDIDNIGKKEFLSYLYRIREDILNNKSLDELKSISDSKFEDMLYLSLIELFVIEQVDYQKGSHAFPDISCGRFGVEVKTTEKDSWVTTGNSIMEGTRKEEVKFIFLFFLKKGGKPDIKIAEYEKCLSDINVTHSPRYQIDMEIKEENNIFNQMGTTYNRFRKSQEKIKLLRKHYKSKGSQAWFMEPDTGEATTPMGIKMFSNLPKTKKEDIQVELYSLFTEVAASDYSAASVYLISKYGIYDPSFRDKFSAGGKVKIKIGNQIFIAPHIAKNILNLIDKIREFIDGNRGLVEEAWEVNYDNSVDLFEKWKKKISTHFRKIYLIQRENNGSIELIDLINTHITNRN
ncbi:MAG: hypothetical protein ACXACY_25650 [Candidatus Hodarchaeales archaeon]|jgi:hypothetical protein